MGVPPSPTPYVVGAPIEGSERSGAGTVGWSASDESITERFHATLEAVEIGDSRRSPVKPQHGPRSPRSRSASNRPESGECTPDQSSLIFCSLRSGYMAL